MDDVQMNRRQFILRGAQIAAAFSLPWGTAMAAPNPATFSFEGKTIYGAVLTFSDVERMKQYAEENAIRPVDGCYYWKVES